MIPMDTCLVLVIIGFWYGFLGHIHGFVIIVFWHIMAGSDPSRLSHMAIHEQYHYNSDRLWLDNHWLLK